ncbi:MAG: energy transducer TonB [Longimicrobiaceae bacterium]
MFFLAPPPSMRHLFAVVALAAAGLTLAPAASAQEADALPTCASQGLQRVAAMVPPGQTTEQFKETLRGGTLFPVGTAVRLLQPDELPALLNEEQFNGRMRATLMNFLRQGIRIDGTVPVLVEVGDDGAVAAVHPSTGSVQVDRQLARTWRLARFEPYVFDGCRAKAWVQVEMAFSTDWSLERRFQGTSIRPRTP